MSEQPSASGGAQTSALNLCMNEISILLRVPAAAEGTSPSPLIPMQYVGPASQQFEQMEAQWYQRFTDLATRSEEAYFRRVLEFESEWYHRCEKKNHEIQKKSVELATLIAETLHDKTECMKLESKFNLCGALELIVYHAKLINKIESSPVHGVQDGIDELAQTPALVAALQDEVAACQLALEDVTACIGCIYSTVSKHARGNDLVITLYEDHYTREECAVLATFLRVQSGWPNGFKWAKVWRRQPRL